MRWILALLILTSCAYAQVPGLSNAIFAIGSSGPTVVTDQGTANNTSGATLALSGKSFSSSAVAVCVVEAANSLGSISDGSNTYIAGPNIANVGASGYSVGLFFAYNANLSGGTITYTKAGSGASAMYVLSATNIATSSAEDVPARANTTATGNGPLFNLTSGTPAMAGDLFLSCLGGQQNGYVSTSYFTQDAGHGWATPFGAVLSGSGTNSGTAQGGGSKINSTTSPVTYTTAIAAGNAPRSFGLVIAALKHQ